jgi:diguanylate cyclase (GGDEF)-like protein
MRRDSSGWSSDAGACAHGRTALHHRLRGLGRELLRGRAEDQLATHTIHGALAVRRLTLGILLTLIMVPAAGVWLDRSHALAPSLLAVGFGAVACELLFSLLERRMARVVALIALKLAIFAALAGLALWAFLAADDLVSHTRHPQMFFVFVIFIGATGLRDDPRLPLCAGFCSLLALIGVALSVPGIAAASPPAKAEVLLRDFDIEGNLGRAAILVCATAIAVTSAARGRAIRRLSLHDGLTGLVNRAAFDAFLAAEGARARRAGRPFAIAMLDVDHFKRLNDAHGHAAGDEVLRWIAELLRSEYRATDLVARYGGEEFALVFVDAQSESVRARLEALRESVARIPLRAADGTPLRVTLSIGLGSWPADGADAAEVLACADARLYAAKRRGRNRLVAEGS